MDYLTIILNGYFNNRKHLYNYFYRELKKAKELQYPPDEFFDGCNSIIQKLKWDIKKEFLAEKKELQENIKDAKSVNDQENEDFFQERLNEISIDPEHYCSVSLNMFTKGRFLGDLDFDEIIYIEKNIIEAFERIKVEEKQTNSVPMNVPQTYFDLFIDETFNLKIEVGNSKQLSLYHYNQFSGDFEYKLKDFAKKALFEIAKLNKEQQNNYLTILSKEKIKFNEFWTWYNELYNSVCNGTFSPTKVDFKHDIRSYFNVPNFDESAIITLQFLNDLHDAAMFKNGELSGLINEIQNLLNPNNQTKTLPPRLQTNLTTQQRAQLFTELVDSKFITNENQDSFNWAIVATDEPETKQPGQWQPVKWKKSKSLLAYFVDVFNSEVLGNDGNNKRIQWQPFELLFGESGLRGSKNDYQKTGSLPNGYEQINILIRSLK